MGSGDTRRHVPALPPVGGNAAGAAYCHHYLVTENCCTLPEALATSFALVYARPCMGDDMTPAQPPASANAPDYPTTRLPRAASLSANPVAADRSASALTVAPSIRVAHTRRASVRLPADRSAAAATSPHQPAMPAARSRWITSSTATGRGGAHACRSARRASKEARDKGLTQRPSGCGRERVSPSLDGRAGEGPAVKSALSNNIFGGQSL